MKKKHKKIGLKRDKHGLFAFHRDIKKGTLSVFFTLNGKFQRRKLKEGVDFVFKGSTVKFLKDIK